MSKRVRAASLVALLALIAGTLATGGPSSLAAPPESELQAAEDRLQDLEAEFETIVERHNLLNERLDDLRSDIASSKKKIDVLSKAMTVNEKAAVRVASELYKGGAHQALESILESRSLSDVQERVAYLESSSEANAEVFEELAADKERLDTTVTELETARTKTALSKEELADLRVKIEAKLEAQADEIEELRAQIEAAPQPAGEQDQAPSTEPTPEPVPAPAPSSDAQVAVNAALAQVGDPYVYGGSGPDSFDCSGLTSYAWAQAGVTLPHSSGMQYSATARVDQANLQPGDLLFYGSPIHHVAMYVGNGQMVEAPYTGLTVRVTALRTSDYVGAGRV